VCDSKHKGEKAVTSDGKKSKEGGDILKWRMDNLEQRRKIQRHTKDDQVYIQ